MLRSRKTVILATSLTVFAIAGAALFYAGFRRSDVADASPAPELISEVPAGAPTLIYADLAAIRASTFYQQRPDKGPIAIPDRDYADFVQSTGFNFETDLDRVVIASWPAGLSPDQKKLDQEKTVVVAEGRFDRKKIRDYALRKGKLDHQDGHDVFLFPTEKQPGNNRTDWISITFLDDHRIAIAQGSSIEPLLSHHDDGAAADPARERAARVAGAAVFAITRVPPIPDHFSPGGVQSAQLMKLARSVQWVTLAAQPEGNNLRVSLEGDCRTPTEARELQAALEVFRLVGRAGLESAKTRASMDPVTYGVLETVLKSADVSAMAEQVRIMVEFTPDILKLGEPTKAQ
jgi:hypothetical protein